MLKTFDAWLENYGETSYDHQSYFAGPIGGKMKALYYDNKCLGTIAVSPMIVSEALLPSGRRLFWKKQRFPIADAHYAMGFALLYSATGADRYLHKAIHFLQVLEETRSPGFKNFCWGYPFDWVTRGGTIKANTPFITTTPYVYEAFDYVHRIDGNDRWLEIMYSIAKHAAEDIKDIPYDEESASCSYYPTDFVGGVINASAYRAFLLNKAYGTFKENSFLEKAEKNIQFILNNQNNDGSWFYAADGIRKFVDHFHTCFVLKALIKIEQIIADDTVSAAIDQGVKYYVRNLFDENGLPKPFSQAPRLTVYRNELYDYAECLNLTVLLKGRYPELDSIRQRVLTDLLARWCKPDGSFRSRKLMVGWDNVPMHRWAQSQTFRSLAFLLAQNGMNATTVA